MAYNGKVEISTSKGKIYLTREDGKSWIYDINSGIFLGLRGNSITRFPFSVNTATVTTKDDFSWLFYEKVCVYGYSIDKNFITSTAELEMIYNIIKDKEITSKIFYDAVHRCYDKKEKLEYIQYCKKNGYVHYRTWLLNCFKTKYKTMFEKYTSLPNYSERIVEELINFPNLVPYYDDLLKHWFLNGIQSLHCFSAYGFFQTFHDTIKEMKKHNIPYEYNRNYPLWYSQMKDTIAIRENMELSAKFSKARENMLNLRYSNEKYEVIIPNSIEEYRAEARAMNNCIERLYLEKVANGETYIVFVRDKANINTPLIDCEIKLSGVINQFLGKNNCYAIDYELRDFRTEYQNYLLNNIFNKIKKGTKPNEKD